MSGHDFEISGGAACVDFCNTVSDRGTEPIERLETYADLVSWGVQAGVLDVERAAALGRMAGDRPEEASRVLARAVGLREALYRTFSALAAGRRPDGDDLARLDGELPAALAWRRLAIDDECENCDWCWRDLTSTDADLAFPLAPVVVSASALLTDDDDLPRLRECDAETCGWLFVDRSRNRSRRWCDMAVCGNRAKARRHYERQAAEG
ncbi:MAG TPA: CGNR zinc finger domain-containing protein [Thermoanaerobaculia bacterium]|nr:CGNR zinc finger domain-containing protein [Thermoanaerobaculia bacterium]